VLLRVEPGTYRVTVGYRLSGTAPSGAVVLTCVPAGPGTPTQVRAGLAAGGGSSVLGIRCPTLAFLQSQLAVGTASTLQVAALRLVKVSP
jgi:hypothetical protein